MKKEKLEHTASWGKIKRKCERETQLLSFINNLKVYLHCTTVEIFNALKYRNRWKDMCINARRPKSESDMAREEEVFPSPPYNINLQ